MRRDGRARRGQEAVPTPSSRTAQPGRPLVGRAGIQHLQRTIGNRAVARLLAQSAAGAPWPGARVQRLYYDPDQRKLHVPDDYMQQTVRWDSDNEVSVDEAKPPQVGGEATTLTDIYAGSRAKMHGWLSGAIGEQVGEMIPHALTNQDAGAVLIPLIDPGIQEEDKQPTKNALIAAFRNPRKYLHPSYLHPYWFADSVRSEEHWMLHPKDYIAQARDLPDTGVDLQSYRTPGNELSGTWWEFACVLIALLKHDGEQEAHTKSDTQKVDDGLQPAVQTLHDYYMGKDVPLEYDDTSTRMAIMKEWGYDLVFTGPVAFTDLHKRLTLTGDEKYVFDITGHTVKVTLRQDLPDAGADMDDADAYYEFHSDPANYDGTEKDQQVEYVWAK